MPESLDPPNSPISRQTHWCYESGTWKPIDDPIPGEDFNQSLTDAGFYQTGENYGEGPESRYFAIYQHRTQDRWLVEVGIVGDEIRLVEVRSFPDLVELTTKLAPLATAGILTSLAEDLADLIANTREDANVERKRRRKSRGLD